MFLEISPLCRPALAALIVGLLLLVPESRGQQNSDGTPVPPPASTTRSTNELLPPAPFCELALGYNYVHLSDATAENLHGFHTSVFVNITSLLSIGGELILGGTESEQIGFYNVSEGRFIYVFGPRVNFWPTNKISVFGQAMFGGVHATLIADSRFGNFSRTLTDEGSAAEIGAGADWWFGPHWAWRILEADYVPTHLGDQWQSNWRISTGIVYAFGRRK